MDVITTMFKKFDVDGNLLLDRDELSNFVEKFFKLFSIELNLNESQLTACFEEIDVNGDGTMEWEEFSDHIISLGLLRNDRWVVSKT